MPSTKQDVIFRDRGTSIAIPLTESNLKKFHRGGAVDKAVGGGLFVEVLPINVKINGTTVNYAGTTSVAVVGSTTNYVSLLKTGLLDVNQVAFPAANAYRLARVVTSALEVTSVFDEKLAAEVTDETVGDFVNAAGDTMTGDLKFNDSVAVVWGTGLDVNAEWNDAAQELQFTGGKIAFANDIDFDGANVVFLSDPVLNGSTVATFTLNSDATAGSAEDPIFKMKGGDGGTELLTGWMKLEALADRIFIEVSKKIGAGSDVRITTNFGIGDFTGNTARDSILTWNAGNGAAVVQATATLSGSTDALAFAGASGGYSFDVAIGIASGGTGATTAAGARTNLGLAIGSNVQAWDADLDALAALATTGLVARTGAGTVAARTITGTANQVIVSNGDGVAGNPTLSTPQDIGISSSVTFANLTLGAGGALRTGTADTNTVLLQAFDVDGAAYVTFATLTAANAPTMDLSAAVTQAGTVIYRVGGTDVAVADGGTGASTAAGARTNLGVEIGVNVQAWDADLDALAALATTGLVVRTGAGTAAVRTITGTANQVIVSNGDGVAGAPTLSTPQDIGTSSTVRFGSLGLGTAPTQQLHVVSTNASGACAITQGTNPATALDVTQNSDGVGVALVQNGANTALTVTKTAAGNVAIFLNSGVNGNVQIIANATVLVTETLAITHLNTGATNAVSITYSGSGSCLRLVGAHMFSVPANAVDPTGGGVVGRIPIQDGAGVTRYLAYY